ncbi:hypothetical protein RJZ90_000124 [Blastomyces dermatitidis]
MLRAPASCVPDRTSLRNETVHYYERFCHVMYRYVQLVRCLTIITYKPKAARLEEHSQPPTLICRWSGLWCAYAKPSQNIRASFSSSLTNHSKPLRQNPATTNPHSDVPPRHRDTKANRTVLQ